MRLKKLCQAQEIQYKEQLLKKNEFIISINKNNMKEQIQKFFAFIAKITFGRKYYKRRYEIAKELYVNYENMTAKDAAKSADSLVEELKSYD